jgi:membrane-bound lytic murein transglycosylase D
VLPAETTNYVPIILAMTIMEKNAAEYGIEGFQLDSPLEYDTVQTPGVTSLNLVADILDIPVTELAEMNPSSLRGKVPESYPVHVPKGTGDRVATALQQIPANHLDAWRMHRVEAGETLPAIGKRYNVAASSIVAVNGLESEQPQEGDRLIIPTAPRIDAPVRRTVPTTSARRRPAATTASSTHRKSTTPVRTTASNSKAPARKAAAIVARNTN